MKRTAPLEKKPGRSRNDTRGRQRQSAPRAAAMPPAALPKRAINPVLTLDALVNASALKLDRLDEANLAGRHSEISDSNAPPLPPQALRSVESIGALVRTYREKNGLSQQNFANLAGVGRRFLSELENGKPSLEFDKVLNVARAANIEILARPK